MASNSRTVKRAASRTIVRKDTYQVTVDNSDGTTEVINKVRMITKLSQPLKKWAREEIARKGKYADVCATWLRDKGTSQ